MKLCINPSGQVGGQLAAVPASLSNYLIAWAEPAYREYEFGWVLAQEYRAQCFGFYSWRVWANQPVTLYPVSEQPTLALQFMLEGNVTCVLSGYGKKELLEHQLEFFYVPMGVQEATFAAGVFHTIHMEFHDHFLEDSLHHYPAMRQLFSRVASVSTEGGFVGPFPLHYRAAHLVAQLQREPKNDALPVTLQKYIFSLLHEYLQQLDRAPIQTAQVSTHFRKLEKLKEYILQSPNIHTHRVAALAQYAAMSSTQLKLVFRMQFGMPLATYVRQQALEKAHWLILESSLTLDDIAEEIGYSNVTNFNQAFKMQFGYLPTYLRKSQE